MTSNNQWPIFFEPKDDGFKAFMSVEGLLSGNSDPALVLVEAADIYAMFVSRMRSVVKEIQQARAARILVPARTIWSLGDLIFELSEKLGSKSLQLDDLYLHLGRDLGVKRKWLEKVIIFRRYLPAAEAIPESLNWGRCEKGTRRVAEGLAQGIPLE